MYKHIIWDFDGTLFDTYPAMGSAFKMTLEEEGIEESLDEILKYMKISITYAIQHFEKKYNFDSKFIERYIKRRREMELELCRPYKGIKEILSYIRDSGRNNYLYTHRGESSIVFLKNFGLYDYFTDFITSEHGFTRKPSPDAINYFIRRHNIAQDEAIMIGDRDLDILAAKNAEIHACFFAEGNEKSDIADYTISDFEQLFSII